MTDNIRALPVEMDEDRAATVHALQEALEAAEAGEFLRVCIVAVQPSGAIRQIWSAGRHRFTMIGGLFSAAHAINQEPGE